MIFRKAKEEDMMDINKLQHMISDYDDYKEKQYDDKYYKNLYEDYDYEDYCVCIIDNKMVAIGYLINHGDLDSSMDWDPITCNSFQLMNFGVHFSYRNMKIGTKLLKFICNNLTYYKNVARLEFTVVEESYEFYKKATKGMNVKFEEICDISICGCEDCEKCSNLDNYHDNDLGLGKGSGYSHICVILKYNKV